MYSGRISSGLLLVGALALALLLRAQPAAASSITGTIVGVAAGANIDIRILDGTDYSNWGSIWGGQIRMTPSGGDFDASSLLPEPADQVIAFCLEPEEHIGYSSYTWQVQDLRYGSTSQGGMGLTRSQRIQELLYNLGPVFGAGLLTNTQALAVQISLWEIVRETNTGPYNLGTGNVAFASGGRSTAANAINLAQGWLDDYLNDGATTAYLEGLLALTRINNQDLLVQQRRQVPVPPTWLMLVPLLWWLRRRR